METGNNTINIKFSRKSYSLIKSYSAKSEMAASTMIRAIVLNYLSKKQIKPGAEDVATDNSKTEGDMPL